MIKRCFDVIFSVTGLLFMSPILLVLVLFIRRHMGCPVFFWQTRPGLGGKPFQMVKIRTMSDACDKEGKSLPDIQRMTKLGQFLRSTSLDELPELWNVLMGDMSIVGPRPLLMEYLPLYTDRQERRHEVKPGITGWAQVNGRNALSWEERLELDVWYVENQSFWLDMKIMWMTVIAVLRREGISQAGHVTMEKFKGSDSE